MLPRDWELRKPRWTYNQGRPLEIVGTPQTLEDQQFATDTANANIGMPYHLTKANCEQLASLAFTGKAESKQLQAWTKLGLFTLAAWGLVSALE